MEIRWLLSHDANVAHLRRHRVSPSEVEEVLDFDTAAVAFEDDSHRAGRLIVLGRTGVGRGLLIVLDTPTADGDAYVVTARPMTQREGQIYEEARGDAEAEGADEDRT